MQSLTHWRGWLKEILRRGLGTWFVVVAREHSCADFRTARPLAPPLPGMGLIGVRPVGIGLHDFTSFEKEQAEFVCGHARNKRFGLVEGHLGGVDQRQLPKPRNSVARRRECLRVVQDRRRNSLLAVVKHVDVTGPCLQLALVP